MAVLWGFSAITGAFLLNLGDTCADTAFEILFVSLELAVRSVEYGDSELVG